ALRRRRRRCRYRDRAVTGEAMIQRGLGGGQDAERVLLRRAVAVAARDDDRQGFDRFFRAPTAVGKGQGGLEPHTLVAVAAEGADQGLFGFGPVMAIDRT